MFCYKSDIGSFVYKEKACLPIEFSAAENGRFFGPHRNKGGC